MNVSKSVDAIWSHKFRFVATFFVLFTMFYGALYAIDFLPEAPAEEAAATSDSIMVDHNDAAELPLPETIGATVDAVSEPLPEVATNDPQPQEPATSILPTSIRIDKLDKTIAVRNPVSRAIADLDAALLDGVVRHPDSATLDQEGNVFILGHSSYLPNVFNPNFQAFNGIQNLEWGDTIELESDKKTFVYRVEKVYEARASEIVVPIANTGSMLTLATCDSFGSTDDRFIVEAVLVGEV